MQSWMFSVLVHMWLFLKYIFYCRQTESFVDLKVGDPLDLDCRANGIPAPKISWFKNGVDIEEWARQQQQITNNTEYSFQNWGRLQIKSTSLEVGPGVYNCIAENQFGKGKNVCIFI